IPSDIKFAGGDMKHVFKKVAAPFLPRKILERKDKMGFTTPLSEWITGEAEDYVKDVFSSRQAASRELVNNRAVLANLENEPRFGRKIWGFLCLELWQQAFHDREHEFKKMAA
ncbi:MAG: asparagine synthetase B, partial [Deltaproteobacteria bacterium]|nr:asparagine synthetase B [Deltaproteobacteria bacterium]